MSYSISVRADNVLPKGSGRQGIAKRINDLRILHTGGLGRVFVGIESLSDSQLRRYGKGVTASECAAATRLLLNSGFDLEVGFIPFDPLVTLPELRENVTALQHTGLWSVVGNVFARLRIQLGSPMVRSKRLQSLFTALDKDMIAWDWAHDDAGVAEVYRLCMSWWSGVEPAYSAIRNLERTAGNDEAAAVAMCIRRSSVQVLSAALDAVCEGKTADFADCLRSVDRRCRHGARSMADGLKDQQHEIPQALAEGLLSALDGWGTRTQAASETVPVLGRGRRGRSRC